MEYYIDISHKSINKKYEELCGDKVEVINRHDGSIIVLSDGMGSGVKANILATLTSKIAITMLNQGATIEDTLETVASTLPECSVRKLAYSTFTIIQIKNNGECYIVEYDNPPFFLYRGGCDLPVVKTKRVLKEKVILESKFQLLPEDLLVVVSDGAVHAGVGETLNLGWEWENINEFLRAISTKKFSKDISIDLLDICNTLYDNKPGDDTTVLAVKLQPIKKLYLFTGPPKDKSLDKNLVEMVEEVRGIKILSGGTTANIVAKAWKEEVKIDLDDYREGDIPPSGYLKGIDLVTEGLITLSKTSEYLKKYSMERLEITGDNAAAKLSKLLIYEASHIEIVAGTTVNPAHQNPDFPMKFNIKLKIIEGIERSLKEIGKSVTTTFI